MKNSLPLLVVSGLLGVAQIGRTQTPIPETSVPTVIVSTTKEPVITMGDVTLLGSAEKVQWSQIAATLTVKAPENIPNGIASVFKITSK